MITGGNNRRELANFLLLLFIIYIRQDKISSSDYETAWTVYVYIKIQPAKDDRPF